MMNIKFGKEVQSKLTKGLLDTIVLEYIGEKSMHGYQIISKIRKDFGVYFGPSTIYPLLAQLENKGYVKSVWEMNAVRPRKVYKLTTQGQEILNFSKTSLKLFAKNLLEDKVELEAATPMMASERLMLATH